MQDEWATSKREGYSDKPVIQQRTNLVQPSAMGRFLRTLGSWLVIAGVLLWVFGAYQQNWDFKTALRNSAVFGVLLAGVIFRMVGRFMGA